MIYVNHSMEGSGGKCVHATLTHLEPFIAVAPIPTRLVPYLISDVGGVQWRGGETGF